MSPLLAILLTPALAHGPVALLDAEGLPAVRPAEVEEGAPTPAVGEEERAYSPVDQVRTCGACHDARYAVTHSFHALLGLTEEASEPLPAGLGPRVEAGPEVATDCLACHLQGEAPPDLGREATVALDLGPAGAEECARCHGPAEEGRDPVELDPADWRQWVRGEIFAWQRADESYLNLAGKAHLGQPWDVHAERLLECTGCHATPDVPALSGTVPMMAHLAFGQPPLDVDAYLAEVRSGAHGEVAPLVDAALPTCTDCHDISSRHRWLPEAAAHQGALACESCHLGERLAPALAEVDRALPGEPALRWRGGAPGELVEPWTPVLLPRDGVLSPYNLVTTWSWRADAGPVSAEALAASLRPGGAWHPDVLAALDTDGDGTIATEERRLDQAAEVEAVRAILEVDGHTGARLVGDVHAVGLHHGVGPREHATRECGACHTRDGRLSAPMTVAATLPPTAEVVLGRGPWTGTLEAEGTAVALHPSLDEAGVQPPLSPRGRFPQALMIVSIVTAAGAAGVGFRRRSP